MSVQNGERPRWAWSGQHVEVVSGWELVVPAKAPPAAGSAEPAAAPDPGPAREAVAGERPAWSWGGPAA